MRISQDLDVKYWTSTLVSASACLVGFSLMLVDALKGGSRLITARNVSITMISCSAVGTLGAMYKTAEAIHNFKKSQPLQEDTNQSVAPNARAKCFGAWRA